MTRFVHLCADEEGFFKIGTIPNRDHNPMDLRHSPNSQHPVDPNGIGVIDNDVDGFADAERQARLWAERGLTLQQAVETLAPPNENNTAQYLAFVADGLGLPVDTPMSEVLEVMAV